MKLLFLLLLSGCATTQPERWQVPTGEKMVCMRYAQAECGLMLQECGQGGDSIVDFECLPSAIYHGPGDTYEPDVHDEGSPK